MTAENKELKEQSADRAYRFQSGKCLITLQFSNGEGASTIEESLVKILSGRTV